RYVGDEVNHPIRGSGEVVVTRRELVVDAALELVDHSPEVRLVLAEAPEVEDGVRALSWHDVVERQQPLGKIEEDGKQVLPRARDDPKAELVVHLRGGRLCFGQELRVRRVEVFSATD